MVDQWEYRVERLEYEAALVDTDEWVKAKLDQPDAAYEVQQRSVRTEEAILVRR